jgi:hypothetical protein
MAQSIRSLSERHIDHVNHIRVRAGISYLLAISIITLIALLLTFSIPRLVAAQEENYPVPIAPENGKTDVPVTNVVFSWKHFYVGTMEYTFQLSTNTLMGDEDLVVEAKTQNGGTTYQYKGTLDYDTTYFWWVSATDPIGGVWSPVFSFTTASEAPPDEPEEEAEESSFMDFFKDIDWLLVGLIGAAVIVVVLAVLYLMKPKKGVSNPNQWQSGRQQIWGDQQQGLVCTACGTQNALGRKFCSNCGGPLMMAGPQQQWGPQQTMKCPSCGMINDPGRKFCSNCGQTLKPEIKQQEQLAPQAVTCPDCGTTNPPGGKFCNNCGGNLMSRVQPPPQQPPQQPMQQPPQQPPQQPMQPPPQQPQPPQPPQPVVCPVCGTTNPPGGKFCNNCGGNLALRTQQEIAVQSFACPVCGAILAPNTNPCTTCGTWLDWRS